MNLNIFQIEGVMENLPLIVSGEKGINLTLKSVM